MRKIYLSHIYKPEFNPAMPYKKKITVYVRSRPHTFDTLKDAKEFIAHANETINNCLVDLSRLCSEVYTEYRAAHLSGMDPVTNYNNVEWYWNQIFRQHPPEKVHYYPINHMYHVIEELTEVLNKCTAWWEDRKNYDKAKQCSGLGRWLQACTAALDAVAR